MAHTYDYVIVMGNSSIGLSTFQASIEAYLNDGYEKVDDFHTSLLLGGVILYNQAVYKRLT